VNGLTMDLAAGLAVPILALHMASVTLAKALRAYSRSRLEEVCARAGRPGRADAIAHEDERTEHAAEALAVLTGLALAALLGVAVISQGGPAGVGAGRAFGATISIALAVGGLGYVAAGVIGRVHAEAVLDAAWPLAGALRTLMTPLTAASHAVEAAAYRAARRSAAGPRPASVEVEIHSSDTSPGEIEADLADLPESTRAMLERVVELTRMDVSELMTPRSAIVALPASTSAQAAARVIHDSGRSRLPLFGEHRDDIVGVLHAKDLYAQMVATPARDGSSPRKLARPALCVPETKDAAELLDEFRTRRVQLAIVLDEFGAVTGLVTLEDLLEQIVGPIDDEHDDPTPVDPVESLGGSRFEVDGTVELELINERLGLHLPTSDDFQTVGGFAFNALGRLPEPGAQFRHGGAEFTVVAVADRSIRRVVVDLRPQPTVGTSQMSGA